jgi:hypothetical protein
VHAVSILRCAIISGEDSSKLTVFLGFPSLSFFDMLLAIDESFGT